MWCRAESSGATEAGSGRSKPSLPSAQSTSVAQEASEEQPPAVIVAKQADGGQRKSNEISTAPAKAASSRLKVEEEPVIKLSPEHGKLLLIFSKPLRSLFCVWCTRQDLLQNLFTLWMGKGSGLVVRRVVESIYIMWWAKDQAWLWEDGVKIFAAVFPKGVIV